MPCEVIVLTPSLRHVAYEHAIQCEGYRPLKRNPNGADVLEFPVTTKEMLVARLSGHLNKLCQESPC